MKTAGGVYDDSTLITKLGVTLPAQFSSIFSNASESDTYTVVKKEVLNQMQYELQRKLHSPDKDEKDKKMEALEAKMEDLQLKVSKYENEKQEKRPQDTGDYWRHDPGHRAAERTKPFSKCINTHFCKCAKCIANKGKTDAYTGLTIANVQSKDTTG